MQQALICPPSEGPRVRARGRGEAAWGCRDTARPSCRSGSPCSPQAVPFSEGSLQDGHFWLCSAGDSPETPLSPPRCPRLGPRAASSLQQHHCSKDVRGSSPPPPAPLRTKAALSLPCLLARYNRALLSGSKSPFQSPSLLQPPSLPQLPPPRFPSQPCHLLVPIPFFWGSGGPDPLFWGDPEDLAAGAGEPGCSLQQGEARGERSCHR